MTLIKIRNRKVASLPLLFRLVLKHIYEPDKMSLSEEEFMQRSFIGWSKKLFRTNEQTYHIGKMAQMIKKDEAGGFNQRKALFKEHNINYKKFHRLTEHMFLTKDRLAEVIKIAEIEKANEAWRE